MRLGPSLLSAARMGRPARGGEHRQRLGTLAYARCAGHAQAATGGHALHQSRHATAAFRWGTSPGTAASPITVTCDPQAVFTTAARSPTTSPTSPTCGSRTSASRSTTAPACRSRGNSHDLLFKELPHHGRLGILLPRLRPGQGLRRHPGEHLLQLQVGERRRGRQDQRRGHLQLELQPVAT